MNINKILSEIINYSGEKCISVTVPPLISYTHTQINIRGLIKLFREAGQWILLERELNEILNSIIDLMKKKKNAKEFNKRCILIC